MKITQARVYSLSVPKKTVFKVAYASRNAAESIIVCLKTASGLEGFGEAVPVKEVTGEIKAEVYQKLMTFCKKLVGTDLANYEEILNEASLTFLYMPSALAALDTALWDLRGQQLKKPLFEIWGNAREFCVASQSLGILSLPETLNETAKYLNLGLSHLKYKIGLNPEDDVKRIKAIRAAFPQITIYLDANQGYSVKEALWVIDRLKDSQIEFMEQPVNKNDLPGLLTVANLSSFPIVADESIQGPESLLQLLNIGHIPMINIKLMKCGGPTNALKMMSLAKKANASVMIGCMIETRLGITTGLHVAQSQDIVRYIDLDGCFDLKVDIVSSGGAILKDGKEFVTRGPGLGLKLNQELIVSLTGS